MNLLLDTHILLWAAGQPEKLPARARKMLLDPANTLFFSPVSLWEVSIKRGLGRRDFQADARRLWRLLLASGYRELPIKSEHTVAVDELPPLHKDPFDRLLLAQARFEDLQLITADSALKRYGANIRKI